MNELPAHSSGFLTIEQLITARKEHRANENNHLRVLYECRFLHIVALPSGEETLKCDDKRRHTCQNANNLVIKGTNKAMSRI